MLFLLKAIAVWKIIENVEKDKRHPFIYNSYKKPYLSYNKPDLLVTLNENMAIHSEETMYYQK